MHVRWSKDEDYFDGLSQESILLLAPDIATQPHRTSTQTSHPPNRYYCSFERFDTQTSLVATLS